MAGIFSPIIHDVKHHEHEANTKIYNSDVLSHVYMNINVGLSSVVFLLMMQLKDKLIYTHI